uniref:Uncharacterized protein n=1 Tax=viral metagenome TaxID=1070528 RepID=A0A6M3Y181_9ZZZZ
MATLEDLRIKSILDMSTDEAIEHLRQIRLSRRIPVRSQTKSTATIKKKAAAKAKPEMSAEQAAELLKILGVKE